VVVKRAQTAAQSVISKDAQRTELGYPLPSLPPTFQPTDPPSAYHLQQKRSERTKTSHHSTNLQSSRRTSKLRVRRGTSPSTTGRRGAAGNGSTSRVSSTARDGNHGGGRVGDEGVAGAGGHCDTAAGDDGGGGVVRGGAGRGSNGGVCQSPDMSLVKISIEAF
jgi:hypothetical protein